MSRHCVEFVLSQTAAILSIVLKMLGPEALCFVKHKNQTPVCNCSISKFKLGRFKGKDEDTTLSERQGALNQMSFFQYVAALLLQQI